MNRVLLHLAVLCFPFFSHGADDNWRDVFAMYPVVQKGTVGATAFSFSVALSSDKRSGFYAGEPILTASEVFSIGFGHPEAGTIPYPALLFHFTDGGFKRLRDYAKTIHSSELVVVILGRAYTTLSPKDILQQIVAPRSKLMVLVPNALDKDDELERLVNKLKDKLTPKRQ